MKKLFLIAPLALMILISCGGEKTDSTKETTATKDTTSVSASANVTDTSAFLCSCDMKCATKEECEKNCGSDCKSAK